MSKYQILKNTDSHNDFNDGDDSTTTNFNTLTTIPLTNNRNDFRFFNGKSSTHRSANNNELLKPENTTHSHRRQQHHFQNHISNGDHNQNTNCHSHKHINNEIEDLIQYTDDNIINNNNQNAYNNSNNTTTTTTTTTKTSANVRKFFTNFDANSNNLMTTLDSAAIAAGADDSTMEVPLLQQNCNNNNNEDRRSNNFYNKNEYDVEYVCICQQKGFAANLNSNTTQSAKSKILWAIALCCIFMVVEFLGGYLAGSLAIMTDAAHLASDCISFIIGLVAIWLGCKPPDAKMSFGYKRFEVMGAIVSILGIWILTATLVLVAIQRIYSNDYDLNANTMMTISGIGILINIIMISILHTSVLDLPVGGIGASHGHSHSHHHNGRHGHSHAHTPSSTYLHHSNDSLNLHTYTNRDADTDVEPAADAVDTGEETSTSIELSSEPMVLNRNLLNHQQDGNDKNLNLRAAMIHVIGDLVQSFGVFLAAILIKLFPKAAFLDPLCTLLFSVIVIMTTVNLFKESMRLIMDCVPQGISIDDLEMDLLNIEGVKSVHHLNVWNHTANHSILMVHLVIDILTDSNTVLMKATHLTGSAKYKIKHSTIQIERMTS